MITFLNDKVSWVELAVCPAVPHCLRLLPLPPQTDWELHGAFFDCIVSVAMLLGQRNLPILEPLLQQVCVYMCV